MAHRAPEQSVAVWLIREQLAVEEELHVAERQVAAQEQVVAGWELPVLGDLYKGCGNQTHVLRAS